MKKIILIILCFCCVFGSYAQNKEKFRNAKDSKFVFMSTIGVAGGAGSIKIPNREIQNRLFSVQVNQLLAYQFNPNFFMGVNLGNSF